MKGIVDTHTHYPGTRLGASPRPIAEIRREFEQAGLGRAWIFTTDGFFGETRKHNDILAQMVGGHRDFFVPFCTVNPHDGADPAIQELERVKDRLGMEGVKLHPWLQAFSLTNPAVIPILRRAGDLGMPVIFHDGSPPYSSPLQIAWAAEQVPETNVILGHAGLDDLYEDSILACLRHRNIHLCCCSLSSGHIAEILQRCPSDRILFGSDGGFITGVVEEAMAKMRGSGASETLLQRIFSDNPRRLIP